METLWKRLVRFEGLDGNVHYGEALDGSSTSATVLKGHDLRTLTRSQQVMKITKVKNPSQTSNVFGSCYLTK